MQKVDNRFGFFAPQAPPKRAAPAIASPLLLSDFVKCETDDNDEPGDPVGQLTAKAQDDAACWKTTATASYAKLLGLLFAPADVRLAVTPLSKASGPASDWSWSAGISDGLEKRAHGTARARLNILLDRIFSEHEDFREEAAEIVDNALNDERAAILSGEA